MWFAVGTLYLSLSTLVNLIGATRLFDAGGSSRSASSTHGDTLMPLPVKKWSKLAETLTPNWPINADYYYFLQTSIKWMLKNPNLPHTIYCPNGDYKANYFISVSSISVYHVIMFAHEGYEHLLHDAVTQSPYIQWTEGVRFHPINNRIVSAVHGIINTLRSTMGLKVAWHVAGYSLFKPQKECAAVQVSVPDGCYLGKITTDEQIALIHSLWHGRDAANPEKTFQYVKSMVTFNGGLGLFISETHELVSWALQTEFGEIGVVQTREGYKRKGYARTVVNAFSKELANEQKMDSFLYIGKENAVSRALFLSSNWQIAHIDDYIQMTKLGHH